MLLETINLIFRNIILKQTKVQADAVQILAAKVNDVVKINLLMS